VSALASRVPRPRGGNLIRENWRTPAFWRWWWRNAVSVEVKIALALLLVTLLLLGGYFAAGRLSGASASGDTDSYVLETTVRKVVTVRDHGKLVIKRVPVVVHRSVIQSRTAYQTVVKTHVVTTPGGVRSVVQKVVRTVPGVNVVVNHTVTVEQPVTSFETTTVTVPSNTVTETRTVSETVTVVSTVTVTSPSP
jgi:hypothetical protein